MLLFRVPTKILLQPYFLQLDVPFPLLALRPIQAHLSPKHRRIPRQAQEDSLILLIAPLLLQKSPPTTEIQYHKFKVSFIIRAVLVTCIKMLNAIDILTLSIAYNL